MLVFKEYNNFKDTEAFFLTCLGLLDDKILDKYGKRGVRALADATPKDSGTTADSWYYTVKKHFGMAELSFGNKNMLDDVPIAIIIQYGHATKNGSWVEGTDYINPALRDVFNDLADELWKEVTKWAKRSTKR